MRRLASVSMACMVSAGSASPAHTMDSVALYGVEKATEAVTAADGPSTLTTAPLRRCRAVSLYTERLALIAAAAAAAEAEVAEASGCAAVEEVSGAEDVDSGAVEDMLRVVRDENGGEKMFRPEAGASE